MYCTAKGGLRRRGRIISVDLSLFVLYYNENFINKINFDDFQEIKNKIKFFDITHFL